MNTPSLDGLSKFLEWLGAKGMLPKATSGALKSSTSRVFGVLDSPPNDVFKVDIEQTLRRFANLTPAVSPDSLRTYRARIEKALDLFGRYLSNPVDFKIDSSGPADARESSGKTLKLRKERHVESAGRMNVPVTQGVSTSSDGLSYPFPLRADLTVMLSNIPRDLKMGEAERLAAFLRALAEDFHA